MKFSHAWLIEYAPIEKPPDEIGRRLTEAGLPLESIEQPDPARPEQAVYDFDIFPNRPDCMSHVGLAREVCALFESPLRLPAASVTRPGPPTERSIAVVIEDAALCHRYSARCVLGVTVGPSPAWLRERLESIGQRSINNVVDATNFVLWELGHPLHPFDLARLAGPKVIVRRARAGETLTTLDGIARKLQPDMLVIADARQAVALAGVMGGQASEIGAATRNVLLESAWFDPVSVRRASKTLGLHTDASHRFERGADQEATVRALDRAATLICEIAGGQITDPAIDVQPVPATPRTVTLRPERVATLLGYDPGRGVMRAILGRLGFTVTEAGAGPWQVLVPSFRLDVEREVDLIEEIARHRGYAAIPATLPQVADQGGGRPAAEQIAMRARGALLASGLCEAVNFAMGDAEEARMFQPAIAPLSLENPLQSQAGSLRTTLLPGLLRNLAHNLNHGQEGCHLFEIGHVFAPGVPHPAESIRVAGVLAGRGLPSHWSLPRREVDLHDASGAVELLCERLAISSLRFASDRIAPDAPIGGLRVIAGDLEAGVLGEIAPPLLRRFGIDLRTFAFDLDLQALGASQGGVRQYRGVSRFPAVRRDLALVVREETDVRAIEAAIRDTSPLPVASVVVFDRYRGAGVPRECASIALQVTFQHSERTLESAEVSAAQETIVTALRERLGATLRGEETH